LRPGRTVLGIRPADLPRFGWIAAAFTLTQIVGLLEYLAATTLFLKTCGARLLPWAFLSGYAVALVLSAGFRRLPRTLPPFTMLAAYFLAHASLLATAGLIGEDGGPIVWAAVLTFVTPFPILCWMTFWNTLQSRLVLREIKLWTPLVAAGASLAQVITGLSTGTLSRWLGVESLFLVCAILLVASVAMLGRLVGVRSGAEGATGEAPAADRPDPGGDPLVARLGRLVFCGAAIKYLVDYQLNQAVAARFATPADVAGFLGRFDSITKAVIFVVQAGLAGVLLGRYPPGRVVGSMPVLLAAASVAMLAGGGFGALLAAHLLFTAYDKGLARACINLLLAPLAPARARQARLRLDGQVLGAGVVTVSLAMILVPALLDPGVAFTVLLVLCAAYLHACLDIDRHYVESLRTAIHDGTGEARAEALGRLRAFTGGRRLAVVGQLLASPDPDRRRHAARELARIREPGAAELLRTAMEREQDPRVQAALVTALPHLDASARALEPLLDSPDARVRANALEAIARLPAGGISIPLLERHLAGVDARPRASAAYAMTRHTLAPDAMRRALDAIRMMLASADPGARAAACWAMSRIGHPAMVGDLCDRLGDPEVTVRRQAALGLETTWSPVALPALRAAATDPGNAGLEPVLSRAILRIEDRTRREVLSSLAYLSRDERLSLSVHLSDLGEREVALLARALRVDHPAYRARLGSAIQLAQHPRTRELLDAAIFEGPGGETRVTLAPLLAALRAAGREPGPPAVEIWSVLQRLHSRRNDAELVAACRQALRDVAAAVLAPRAGAEALPEGGRRPPAGPSGPLPEGGRRPPAGPSGPLPVAAGAPAAWSPAARLLALLARDAALERSLSTSLARRDPRSLSLTVELIEKVLPASPLRTDLALLVESASDDTAFRRAAREVLDRAPGGASP
jgi:HEAT repeat protein